MPVNRFGQDLPAYDASASIGGDPVSAASDFVSTNPADANYIGALSATALAALAADLGRRTLEVTPEMFGAVGDGVTDDMAAFQLASNFLNTAGGGRLLLDRPSYYLSEYSQTQVQKLCEPDIGVGLVSKTWRIPSNVQVESQGHTTLIINGGSSSPLGFSWSVNVIAYTETELVTSVTSADQQTQSVVVASTTGLTVGQMVMLSRPNGEVFAGIPWTPSREHSPVQFLTIKSIVSTTVTFEESFIHNYEAANGLNLYRPTQGRTTFTRDVSFKGITLRAVGGTEPYVLISRALNTSFDDFHLENGVSMSWGMLQDVSIGTMTLRIPTGNNTAGVSVEAVSNMSLESFAAEGNGSSNPLGALFFSDACRNITIGDYAASNYSLTALSAFYGVDVRADRITLRNCGTSATNLGGYHGALTLGFPASGAWGRSALAADAFLVRNTGPSRFHVETLTITGDVQVPVRVHDCAFSYGHAFIDFDNAGESSAPILIAQSGDRRSDVTYFPAGGVTSVDGELLVVNTVAGTPATVSGANAYSGIVRQAETTATSSVAAGQTVIPVADASVFRPSQVIYYVNLGSESLTAISVTISSISGNNLTVSAPLAVAIVSGQGFWGLTQNSPAMRNVRLGRVILDGVEVSAPGDERFSYPAIVTGAGPFTADVTLQTPGWGEWELQVSLIGNDNNHYVFSRYQVTWSEITPAFPLSLITQIVKNRVRTSVDVTAATIATTGLVTVSISATTSGRTARFSHRWVPIRRIESFIS